MKRWFLKWLVFLISCCKGGVEKGKRSEAQKERNKKGQMEEKGEENEKKNKGK